ncbi:hypothetical protein [Kitasatospora sp. NPDC004289]
MANEELSSEDAFQVSLPVRLAAVLDRIAAETGDRDLKLRFRQHGGDAADLLSAAAEYVWDLAARLPPLTALGYLVELTASGLRLLGERDLVRAEALRSGRVPAPAVDPSGDDAWQLHLEAVEAASRGVLSSVAWQRLVSRLPLPVIDDLIDSGKIRKKLRPAEWPGPADRLPYVLARVDPAALTNEQIETLGWQDELRRRALVAGEGVQPVGGRHDQWSLRSALLDGDLNALETVEPYAQDEFPRSLAQLVSSLQAIRRGSAVTRDLGNDKALFGVLEDCMRPDRLIAGNTPFHYWAGTRRLYRLLDDLHWALAVEPETTETARREVMQQASALRNDHQARFAEKADQEARAVQAYLCFLCARPGDGEQLDKGVGLLEEVLRRGPSRNGGAGRWGRQRLSALSQLLQRLRQNRKPHEILNPYLALCVEHGSTEWRQGWRDLRKQVPPERFEYINGAKDRIQRMEAARRLGTSYEELYELPVDERFLWVPGVRSLDLHPPMTPMARRSPDSTAQDTGWTAVEAARQIIDSGHKARNPH